VTFHAYHKIEEHHALLSQALSNFSQDSWKVIERQNSGSDFPSDFSVIKVGVTHHGQSH